MRFWKESDRVEKCLISLMALIIMIPVIVFCIHLYDYQNRPRSGTVIGKNVYSPYTTQQVMIINNHPHFYTSHHPGYNGITIKDKDGRTYEYRVSAEEYNRTNIGDFKDYSK